MRLFSIFTSFLTIASSITPFTNALQINPNSPNASLLLHLPEPTSWFKDIAARRDGSLLVVRLDQPSVYLVHPDTGTSSTITTFTNVTGALGIAEYAPDVFAVTIGDFDIPTLSSTPGTYSVASLDLSKGLNADGTVTPTTLAAVPAASNLNGITFRGPSTLYAADSKGAQISSIDTHTRAVGVAVPSSPLLTSDTIGLPLGVTALKWDARGQQLVLVNANQKILGQIPALGATGFGAPAQIASSLATGGAEYDGFDLDPYQGNIYVVTGPTNTLNFVSRDGSEQSVITPSSSSSGNATILGGTGTGWGRAQKEKSTLYVTTNGEVATGAQLIAYQFASD